MTESALRQKMVDKMRSWLGRNEGDGSHREIIDIYNSHTPLARGYKLTYTDAWCAGCVSAASIACGLTDIAPTEVGVGKLIALYQALGRWVENDRYEPLPGDLIIYAWDDGVNYADTDKTSGADHVGMVERVDGETIHVIEGNMNRAVNGYDGVARRAVPINGRYIRGFCCPNYAGKAAEPEGERIYKVYLSPSDQGKNTYAWGDTNERDQMRKVADVTEQALLRTGRFMVINGQHGDMYDRIAESNAWEADLHVCNHSNACNGVVMGTRAFAYDLEGKGYEAVKAIYERVAPISPGTSENIKTATFREIVLTSCPCAYVEVEFHDTEEGAKWIIGNTVRIGEAIAQGICDYFGVPYAPVESPNTGDPDVQQPDPEPQEPTGEKLYRVQVGAFRNKAYAEAYLQQVQEHFPQAFVVAVDTD